MAAVAEISGETVTAITTTAAATATATATAKNAKFEESKADFQREVENLVDILSKLNPLAEEFVPSSYHHVSSLDRQQQHHRHHHQQRVHDQWPMMMMMQQQQLQQRQQQQRRQAHFFSPVNKPPPPFGGNAGGVAVGFNPNYRRRRTNYNQSRRRLNGRAFRAHREDSIRRTVYVSDIDQLVTEEQLAGVFSTCGQVVDCRVCGDPHSVLRFAFVEFADEHGARAALRLGGTMLGYYPVRVLPSKTAILPVNSTFLPRSEDEREMCARTVYCTNIDKKVSQDELSNFFETACGEVSRLRLLGDHVHSTRIAFVEFAVAESAITALNCSGMVVGSQPIRVSPSKTPIRPRVSRSPSQ